MTIQEIQLLANCGEILTAAQEHIATLEAQADMPGGPAADLKGTFLALRTGLERTAGLLLPLALTAADAKPVAEGIAQCLDRLETLAGAYGVQADDEAEPTTESMELAIRRDALADAERRLQVAGGIIENKFAAVNVTTKLLRSDLDLLHEKTRDGFERLAAKIARLPEASTEAAAGLNPCGCWEAGATYQRGDVVEVSGSSYISLVNGNREKPSRRGGGWMLLAAGSRVAGGGTSIAIGGGGSGGLAILSETESWVTLGVI